MTKIMIAGGGTLGSQIAWQTAISGFKVIVYDKNESGLEDCKKFHQRYARIYMDKGSDESQIKRAIENLSFTTDIQQASEYVYLVSESVPENPKIKAAFYQELSKHIDDSAIITTNSSTLLPSDFVEFVSKPERFLAMHFANYIWQNNIAEIMGHKSTDASATEKTIQFAKDIGMVPVQLNKEQNGYILNSILVPFVSSAMALVANGVATHEDVDKTMLVSGFASGPFQILDVVGLETAYNIEHHWGTLLNDKQKLANAAYVKEHYLDKGKLGIKTGEGFYKYPNPKFKDPGFLK
ncbi:3-hydroxyacyl-CoA dehydrogenase [Fulvivirga lutea]|uniref:3-hydroxyacyl-CoA dehydrogenase n=1 Tax=Fulvivirga lutea TaxID=2810512 RepID=A0A974WE42_9BACT|nr:3-hydroxyacyl-CoA dehydrogenase [Fulvivirga lutea]QSE96060.1 3-hydroxyacyl-CoA dehydrogenase [Fulvivirga lutea]